MKSYKLIKTYPGSPKLGFTTNKTHYLGLNDYLICGQRVDPIKYSEFWEEVVEKDYEILSFIHINILENQKPLISSFEKGGISKIYRDKISWVVSFLNSKIWKIHSIKRLSDGEIFTIGDKIIDSKISKNKYKIERFNIHQNELIVETVNKSTHTTSPFSLMYKDKQPLFTTEDGVAIYNISDEYYMIDNWSILPQTFNFVGEYKHFSTKQTAEEYILMNKPCLSLKDINDYYLKTTVSEHMLNFFKQLVKSKL